MTFRVSGARAIAATQSPLNMTGGATFAICLRELILTTSGVPTSDQAVQAQLRRSTTAGTGTAATPRVCSPGAVGAARAAILTDLSAEPTYTANSDLGNFFFNPRLRCLWQALDPLAEICSPLTVNNGLGVQCLAVGGGAGNLVAEAGWREA